MPSRALAGWLVVLGLCAVAAGAAAPIALEPLVTGLDRPVGLADAADGSDRLFVFTLPGKILVWDGEKILARPFLDITDRVDCCDGEKGLSGLAFHPDFARNGFFFVAYDGPGGVSRVSRFRVSADPSRADAASERVLLRVPQPFSNHNLGQLQFGPDGFLYIASGDGGSGGDPMGNGQDLGTLLGKILRIDVDRGDPYAVPSSNPFVGVAGAEPEIWSYGIRNTWRFSFDRRTGEMFMGDVGQDGWEEINLQPAGAGGLNFGWSRMEGSSCFDPPAVCNDGSLVLPILEYPHSFGGVDQGCRSVTGGYRYRGPAAPTLPRFYVFGDFCGGEIWGARPNAAGAWVSTLLLQTDLFLVSFGEDRQGRLYAIDFAAGAVYRIVGNGLLETGFENGLAGFAGRQGNVAVTAPGLRGSGGALEVGLDGRPTISMVRSTRPRGESTFRVSFDLDANGADPRAGSVEILRLLDEVPHVKVALEPGELGRKLALWVRTGTNQFRRVGGLGIPRRGAVRVTVDWMRASAAGVADGQAALTIGPGRSIRATDLANRNRILRQVQLGLPGGSAGAAVGSLRFDNYVSTP